ncbi:MAG: hypothetical protein DRP32_05225 [Thermotogae bacterium]|nr:MAG: hypothetical protein DRP32_05225 [Thermotogota bacterium]
MADNPFQGNNNVEGDDTYRRAKRVFDETMTERHRWEELWRECSELVQPEYMDIDDNWDPMQLIGDNVFDGSPRVAAQIASSGLFGYSTNPADEWVSVGINNPKLKGRRVVRDWIADTNRLLMQTFEKYDIYKQLVPAFQSIVPIGTASITVEEDVIENGIRYRFWHPGDYALGTDGYNRINQFVTKKEYQNHKLLDIYTPEELGPELVREAMENPFTKTEVNYVVMQNSLYSPGNPFAKYFKFSGYHLLTRDQRVIRTDGFQAFPAAVWRWTEQGRLTYGLGMAAKALPDIYILNQSARSRIEAEQKAADPAMNIPRELRDDYHLGPGGRNFYRSPDRQIYPVSARYDYPAAIDSVNRYTEIVNKHMLTDFFVALVSSTTRRTTTEVAELMQEKAAMLGPVVSFMNRDFLDPIVQQTLRILGKQGKLPDPPRELLEEEVQLSFLGPLAVAQKYAQMQKRIMSPINTALTYAQLDPSVLDNFDFDKTTRLLGESFMIPYGILREETEVAAIRQQRAAAAQAAQAQEQAQEEQKDLMQHGSKAIEPNSMLDQAQQAAAGG